jgi:peptide/nickel transport system ATP-binding protein
MIAEPLIVHHLCNTAEERKKRVFELLRQVNLSEEHYNRYPHQFSGGQRQRIGIARALAVEPELLILDESVSALDVSVQAQVLNLLNHLKETLKLTFIFISHDLNTVHYMADRMIVLKDGRIMEEGVPDNIFTSPKSEYTARLIEAIPGMNYQKP